VPIFRGEIVTLSAKSIKGYAQSVVKYTSNYQLWFSNCKCAFKILQTDNITTIYIFKKSEIKINPEVIKNT